MSGACARKSFPTVQRPMLRRLASALVAVAPSSDSDGRMQYRQCRTTRTAAIARSCLTGAWPMGFFRKAWSPLQRIRLYRPKQARHEDGTDKHNRERNRYRQTGDNFEFAQPVLTFRLAAIRMQHGAHRPWRSPSRRSLSDRESSHKQGALLTIAAASCRRGAGGEPRD